MIESIEFKNFKCLRDTTLPLSPCTILVGPNGSGKTTVLQALDLVSGKQDAIRAAIITAPLRDDSNADAIVNVYLGGSFGKATFTRGWKADGSKIGLARGGAGASPNTTENWRQVESWVAGIRVYSLHANAIAAPVELKRDLQLAPDGAGLAGVLTRLRDHASGWFEALNEELASWLPEFEQVCLDTDNDGRRVFHLRTREGHHAIRAVDLSQGTLLALAMLTLAFLPDPPSLIGLEEPDRGIHPRLLRRVQDAIYRLSHPESCGEKREPVQVIATTHSPYFLDLFKDHPEEIVIANKVGLDVQFQRLSEQPHIQEILGDAPLGEIWYTGILGGVPANS